MLAKHYPQLRLAIQAGMKDTPEYIDVVLRGKPVFREPGFIGSEEDSFEIIDTPAG